MASTVAYSCGLEQLQSGHQAYPSRDPEGSQGGAPQGSFHTPNSSAHCFQVHPPTPSGLLPCSVLLHLPCPNPPTPSPAVGPELLPPGAAQGWGRYHQLPWLDFCAGLHPHHSCGGPTTVSPGPPGPGPRQGQMKPAAGAWSPHLAPALGQARARRVSPQSSSSSLEVLPWTGTPYSSDVAPGHGPAPNPLLAPDTLERTLEVELHPSGFPAEQVWP